MAKKKTGSIVGGEVQPTPTTPPDDLGDVVSKGVGLRQGEWAELDEIATGYGLTRNAVAVWVLRTFLSQHREGAIKLPVEAKTTYTLGS